MTGIVILVPVTAGTSDRLASMVGPAPKSSQPQGGCVHVVLAGLTHQT
ncbi:hypothetical protein [Streptomyces sp. NPDC002133]